MSRYTEYLESLSEETVALIKEGEHMGYLWDRYLSGINKWLNHYDPDEWYEDNSWYDKEERTFNVIMKTKEGKTRNYQSAKEYLEDMYCA